MNSKEILDEISSLFPDDLKHLIKDIEQEDDKLKLLCNIHHALARGVPNKRKNEEWVSAAIRIISNRFIELKK